METEVTMATAPAGIYAKRTHFCDNDGLADPLESVYDVLMKNNDRWFFLDEKTEGGGWVELHHSYPVFEPDEVVLRISGPGLPVGQVWRMEG